MAEQDPFDGIVWPEPSLAAPVETAREQIITEVRAHFEDQPRAGWIARVNTVLRLVTFAAQELVPRAALIANASGPEKKRLVRLELMAVLRLIEDRYDILPALIQPAAFRVIEFGLGRIIERVYRQAKAAA